MASLNFFEMETVAEGYKDLCNLVLEYGDKVEPRGKPTREILNPTIVLRNPACALPVGIGRGCNKVVGAIEAVQLCGAFSDPDLTALISPYYQSLREPYTQQFWGAYGSRISDQTHYIVNKLESDKYTRQAVITLWDPAKDNIAGMKDYPCTVSLQFYIRDDKLHLSTNMRSNDVWLGLAYDLFQFGQLQWTIANMLGIRAGDLIHRPVSLHMYVTDFEKVDALSHPGSVTAPFIYGFESVNHAWRIGTQHTDFELTPSEQWYQAALAPAFQELEDAQPR